jgi:hypothetical protein
MQENLVSSFDTITQDGVVDLQELNSNVSKLVEENDSQKLKKL